MNKTAYLFLLDSVRSRRIVYELAKRDFQQQYQGSYLGFIWTFLQPLLYVLLLYVIFSLGFRKGFSDGLPFSLYLLAGIVPWFYFSENFSSITHVIKNHSFLVKKVDFRLSILPIVKLLSTLPTHLFLILVATGVSWLHGYPPTVYSIQILYYLVATHVLLLGIGWLTSSTGIFVRDVPKLVAISVQFGFWLTPIVWDINMVPASYHWIVKLNPLYYVVTGYRDSLLTQTPFWHRVEDGFYFWGITLLLLFIGVSVYQRLRPHLPEVL